MYELTLQNIFWMSLAYLAEQIINHQPAFVDHVISENNPDMLHNLFNTNTHALVQNTEHQGTSTTPYINFNPFSYFDQQYRFFGSTSTLHRPPYLPIHALAEQVRLHEPPAAINHADTISGLIHDDKIPEHYLCPLTLLIMTDPIHLRGDVTNTIFERSAITRWLTENSLTHTSNTGSHPLNPSARFSTSDILPAHALKKEIDNFVDQILANKAPDLKT